MPKKISIHEKGELLKDAVLSSSDGLITTFAVVAGAQGAQLDTTVILVIGIGNLIADGISMAAGNYIGIKSEKEYEDSNNHKKHRFDMSIFSHVFASFIPFVLIGSIPLMPYLFGSENAFKISFSLLLVTLFCVGCIRSYFTRRNMVMSGLESLAIGGLSATAAYAIGYLIKHLTGNNPI